jgi:hypothetical protein
MVGSFAGCCARATSGHAMAEPAATLMKSRRRIVFPRAQTARLGFQLQQDFVTGGMGLTGKFAGQQS